MPEGSTARIVVGVDGSDHARRALDWAVGEARAHDAVLVVVHAYTTTLELLAPEPVPFAAAVPPDPRLLDELEDAAQKLVAEEIERVDVAGLTVEHRVASGTAAEVLLHAAEDANLVVVGSRGRGGVAGLLLGSVSQQVANRAPCPAVIVPTPREPG